MIRIPATFVGLHWAVDLTYYLIDVLKNSWVGVVTTWILNILGFGYIDDYVIQPFLDWTGLEWMSEALEPLHGWAYAVELTNWIFHNIDIFI